jgi:hypothetical protein
VRPARLVAAIVLAAWLVVGGLGGIGGPIGTLGAAPSGPVPTATPSVIGTGDPRSDGEGPGLQGSPLLIAFGVVSIGFVAAAATVLFLRLRRPD